MFNFINIEFETSNVIIEFLFVIEIWINIITKVTLIFYILFLFRVDFLKKLVHIHTLINI